MKNLLETKLLNYLEQKKLLKDLVNVFLNMEEFFARVQNQNFQRYIEVKLGITNNDFVISLVVFN